MADRCLECGFDYASVTPSDAADTVRGFGRRYRPPLTRFLPGEDGDSLVRTRPGPWTWSALEYACHLRDVLAIDRERIGRALAEDRPELKPMGRDERARRERYNEQDPAAVVDEVGSAADGLATALAGVPADGWSRTVLYPGFGERDVLWMAANAVHEGNHHLLDIGRVLRTVRGTGP